MNLGDVMDEVAGRLKAIPALRVHPFPADTVNPPAAVVAWPDRYDFDETYGRGSDRLTVPLVVVVARVPDRAARDQLSKYCNGTGASSVKLALETGKTLIYTPTGAQATDAGASTTTYLVTLDADASDVPIGATVILTNSAGVRKEGNTSHVVSGKASAFGFTNISVSPPFPIAPVAGDLLKVATFAASPTGAAFDSLRVTGIEFDVVQIGQNDYLAATFMLDITGPGSA